VLANLAQVSFSTRVRISHQIALMAAYNIYRIAYSNFYLRER
jgi:hypothetical protein